MSLINFSGMASGIDSEALITATSDATRKQRVTPNQTKITELQSTDDAFTELKARMVSLQSILRDFSSVAGGPLAKSAQSSDETVATAAAGNSAANGTYSLTVAALARNGTHSFGSSSHYASADALVGGSGTVSVHVGNTSAPYAEDVSISVTGTTTLSQFVTQFNNTSKLALATVVNVGSDASPDYRIVINSNNTGLAKGAITVDALPGGITGLDVSADSPAADASFSLSGVGTVTRSSNTVADLIPGVTFNLKSAGGPSSITVSDDISTTTSKIQEFVDAYNKVIQYVNENNSVDRQENGNTITNVFGSLAKTSLDDNIVFSLRSVLSSSSYSGGTYIKILADMGITTDSGTYDATEKTGGGTLKFDSTTFAEAMAKEPLSVGEIFQDLGDTAALTGGTIDQFVRYGGLLDTTITSNKEQISSLNDRIAQAEASILKNEEVMRQRFATLESTISKMQSQQQSLTSALSSLR